MHFFLPFPFLQESHDKKNTREWLNQLLRKTTFENKNEKSAVSGRSAERERAPPDRMNAASRADETRMDDGHGAPDWRTRLTAIGLVSAVDAVDDFVAALVRRQTVGLVDVVAAARERSGRTIRRRCKHTKQTEKKQFREKIALEMRREIDSAPTSLDLKKSNFTGVSRSGGGGTCSRLSISINIDLTIRPTGSQRQRRCRIPFRNRSTEDDAHIARQK